ncbi:hypothetical protein MalM25_08920 [Planctomycetes bacterium MalM25]|nr:hypothetical protein MalM25_08920 [Planctomycetes bacterium MalM25]
MRLLALLLAAASLPAIAIAHEGHDHGVAAGVLTANSDGSEPTPGATTGSGDLQFKYNAELSALPEEIAKGILPAHGGFAKAPNGEIYFGLNRTGLIKLSADLRTKTLVSASENLTKGGLHNAAYVDRDGGLLILPDNNKGRVLVVKLDGSEVKTLGVPTFLEGKYAPTDADVAADGLVYICNGYGASKTVFTLDLDALDYGEHKFGGRVPGKGRTKGKFSTNHGVTFDPTDETLVIADRERQWAQKLTTAGEFVEGYDMDRHNPCDVDFVEHNGERLMVAGCLTGPDKGVVQILRDGKVVSTLRPKNDLGLSQFEHIHNAAGVSVNGKLYVLCYGWNPGCYAVLEHVAE